MKLSRAVIAGVLGALVVLLIVAVGGRVQGAWSDGDLCGITAAALFLRSGGVAWWGGLATQLVIGAVAGVVYGALFEWVTAHAGAWIGLVIGVGHAAVAGIAMGFVPAQRLIAARVMPPAAFLEYRGVWCVLAFVLAHVVFGTLQGWLYGRTRHAPAGASRSWVEVPPTG